MQSLFIEGSNYTPKVKFNLDGNLELSGKSLPEDSSCFYEPILKWIHDCDIEKLNISIRLDYMNSSSAHQISKFLMLAKDNTHVKQCEVFWYYETDDEDGLDFGRELEFLTDFKFNFFEYSEVESSK